MARWFTCLLAIAFVAASAREARADKVDDLVADTASTNAKVRERAAYRLGKTKDQRGMAPLAKLAAHDSDSMVRKVSLHSMTRLAKATGSSAHQAHARGVLLRIAQQDSDPSVRRGATVALKKLGVRVRVVAPQPGPRRP